MYSLVRQESSTIIFPSTSWTYIHYEQLNTQLAQTFQAVRIVYCVLSRRPSSGKEINHVAPLTFFHAPDEPHKFEKKGNKNKTNPTFILLNKKMMMCVYKIRSPADK